MPPLFLGDLVLPGDRIRTEETELNTYTVRMRLIIRRVEFSDFSGYKCAAKNSVGESEGYTRLYGKCNVINYVQYSKSRDIRSILNYKDKLSVPLQKNAFENIYQKP